MFNLSPVEVIIIALTLFLLFGAKKLPEAAKSIGQSFKIFKQEISDVKKEVSLEPTKQEPAPAATIKAN